MSDIPLDGAGSSGESFKTNFRKNQMASFTNALSGRLLVLLGTVGAVPAAIYIGRLAGNGNTSQIGLILGGMFGLLVLLGMGEKVWWAIPVAFALDLPPIPFAGRQLNMTEVATAGGFAFFFARLLMHKQKVNFHRKENVSVFMYCAWVFMIFCMNPVGLSSMGADAGGGRFYLMLIVALLSFLVVSQQTITEFEAKGIIACLVAGGIISAAWNFVLFTVFPASVALGTGGVVQTDGDLTWHQSLSTPAFLMMVFIFSRYRFSEVFSMMRPWTLIIIVLSVALGLFSGKRAVFLATLFVPALAAMLRKEWNVVWIGAIIAPLFLMILAMGHNNLYTLTYGPQRALSFIPGMQLDADVREDTDTEFRPALRQIAMEHIKADPFFGRKGYKIDFSVILDAVYGQIAAPVALEYRDQAMIRKIAMTGSWHTTWLGIAADFGIPAAVIFLIFYMQMIGLGIWLLRQGYIRDSIPYRTLVMMVTITVIISLLRSWTSGHSTLVAQSLWWQYALLIALKYMPKNVRNSGNLEGTMPNEMPGRQEVNESGPTRGRIPFPRS